MDKINGQEVKREIVAKRYKDADGLALLSGFVRVAFSVLRKGAERHLVLDCQSDFVRDFIESLMMKQFKVLPMPSKDVEIGEGDAQDFIKTAAPQPNKTELRFCDSDKLLGALYILEGDDYFSIKGIDPRFGQNAAAYVCGVFLGCGSLSVPKQGQKSGGYHIEFALGNDTFADEFTEFLKAFDISLKRTTRAEKCVVYAKDIDTVSDCLKLLGATQTLFELTNTVAVLDMRERINRRINCDVANINRAVNAAVDVSEAIELIKKHAGLDVLDKKLKAAAMARLDNPQASLGDLADLLGISKSGLKHRYDKITELAKTFTEDGKRS